MKTKILNEDELNGIKNELFEIDKSFDIDSDTQATFDEALWKRCFYSLSSFLEHAINPSSRLHKYFDWNDNVAALKEKAYLAITLIFAGFGDDIYRAVGNYPYINLLSEAFDKCCALRKQFPESDVELARLWRLEQVYSMCGGDYFPPLLAQYELVTGVDTCHLPPEESFPILRDMIIMKPNPRIKRIIMDKTLFAILQNGTDSEGFVIPGENCLHECGPLDFNSPHVMTTGLCILCQLTAQRFLSDSDMCELVKLIRFLQARLYSPWAKKEDRTPKELALKICGEDMDAFYWRFHR